MRSNSNKEYRWTYFVELFSKRQLILAGRAVIGRRLSGAQPYGVITLFNNVKYIRNLEDGSSQQAPLGMVKVSIAETNSQFG
jgi:hypothetical protein